MEYPPLTPKLDKRLASAMKKFVQGMMSNRKKIEAMRKKNMSNHEIALALGIDPDSPLFQQ